jgi:hypothetical protein
MLYTKRRDESPQNGLHCAKTGAEGLWASKTCRTSLTPVSCNVGGIL